MTVTTANIDIRTTALTQFFVTTANTTDKNKKIKNSFEIILDTSYIS